ncbi:NADH-quinone oxidoreductase subunit L [uncultured Desulfosarcina sp.]|uniref:NADH-quinone oxidoreductase subunit 5 family protein n=1 Tax=uncultured Desulfosarcina sp. TaxID=218289 RepID=UPI0029C6616A|nr:NADH-quinone oxidoreductase subunit L [uncultured Desulfosarcina sp.]
MQPATPLPLSLIVTAVALLLPMLAFGVIMLATRSRHRLSAAISIGAAGLSLLAAVYLLVQHWQMQAPLVFQTVWLVSGQMAIPIGILLDPLSLLMLTVVATISFLVQVYSLGYMAGDPGFGRYYGCMSLFAWAMLSLTVSSSLLQLYIFWELVGLASYLLIGFWFDKFSASEAGKKAFVMTRTGDVAFLLGLVLLWLQMGTLDIPVLTDPAAVAARLSPGMITLTALLIFGGIIGKSAQFPLLTWLPDAMEGPTPVSALLHSATMVAAGVYLFSRLFGYFSLSPTAMAVCLAIGTISMLLASSMAMVARDIKQVWAFSTISQLGFMLMGLGSGSLFAGVFHLTTHAGFKALLFLCAGVLIHRFHTNDMFEIGRLGGRRLKATVVCMIVGAAALSGLPPFSGFFSKEMILGQLLASGHPIAFLAALLGAFLTTYYAFRLIFILLFPLETDDAGHADGRGGHHGAWGERAMIAVLVCLAGVTVVLGFFEMSLHDFLARGLALDERTPAHFTWLPMVAGTLAVAAALQAWLEFGRKKARQIGWVERIPLLADLFGQRWYLDRLYRYLLDTLIYRGVSRLFTANDRRVIDGALDGLGRSTIGLGRVVDWVHSGMIQYRLMIMVAAVILLILFIGWGG